MDKKFVITQNQVDKNNGDFVAAIQDAGFYLPPHDDLRWTYDCIEAVSDGKVVAIIEVIQ